MATMYKLLFWCIFSVGAVVQGRAQINFGATASKASLVYNRMQKEHVQPIRSDLPMAKMWIENFIKQADPYKYVFLKADVLRLQALAPQLLNDLQAKDSVFITTAVLLYAQRQQQSDSLLATIGANALQLQDTSSYTFTTDTSFTASLAQMKEKWRQKLQIRMNAQIREFQDFVDSLPAPEQSGYIDSIGKVFSGENIRLFRDVFAREMQADGGIKGMVISWYLKALAQCYDPYSNYLTYDEKQSMESDMGVERWSFGIRLRNDTNGLAVIDEILPDSPADVQGEMRSGDRILAIQWKDEPIVLLNTASELLVSDLLDKHERGEAKFTIRKTDGTEVIKSIAKKAVAAPAEEKLTASLWSDTSAVIGYLKLPSFYRNWESKRWGGGAADDLAKAVKMLNAEQVKAIVLDLRNNGGGSVEEAIEMAAVFLGRKPIMRYRDNEQAESILYPDYLKQLYSGPLLVMINGESASASEILAAALQDHGRAVLVGSSSFGKATSQTVLPLDSVENTQAPIPKPAISKNGYVKVTTNQVFRITGLSAQYSGIQPDVLLPDMSMADDELLRNRALLALQPKPITGIRTKAIPHPQIAFLRTAAAGLMQQEPFFKSIEKWVNRKADPDFVAQPLNYKKYLDLHRRPSAWAHEFALRNKTLPFMVYPVKTTKTADEKWERSLRAEEALQNDPYAQLTYKLALAFAEQQ